MLLVPAATDLTPICFGGSVERFGHRRYLAQVHLGGLGEQGEVPQQTSCLPSRADCDASRYHLGG